MCETLAENESYFHINLQAKFMLHNHKSVKKNIHVVGVNLSTHEHNQTDPLIFLFLF